MALVKSVKAEKDEEAMKKIRRQQKLAHEQRREKERKSVSIM